MAFRLKAGESVEEGLKRIAREQVDRAIAEIDNAKLPREEAVHQVRKRCKKIRGVLRLFRPALGETYRAENAFFRRVGRQLAGLRDAEVLVQTYDAVVRAALGSADSQRFAPMRRRLVEHRRQGAADKAAEQARLENVRAQMSKARERITHWGLTKGGFEAIEGGLLETYARGREALHVAYKQPGATTFHEWRKRAKYHRYHIRLLRDLWRAVLQPWRDEVAALSELLGDDHDLAVLRAILLDQAKAPGVECDLRGLLRLVERRSSELRAQARPLGKRVFAEKPKQIGRRLRRYWKVWQTQ